jgi:hypothetical protein
MKEDMVAVNPDMSFWAGRMLFVQFREMVWKLIGIGYLA